MSLIKFKCPECEGDMKHTIQPCCSKCRLSLKAEAVEPALGGEPLWVVPIDTCILCQDEQSALDTLDLQTALEKIYELVDYRGTDEEIKQTIEQALKGYTDERYKI